MKHHSGLWSTCLLATVLAAGGLCAAENYQASLQAGDAQRQSQHPDAALTEYEAALGQAATDTERALAMGKKGYVLAFDRKDYPAARALVLQALALENTAPVAQVTALQVMAECQMKADKNYAAATTTLEKAGQLAGVDWAQPMIALSLGDCRRFAGQFDQAMASYQRIVDMPDADATIKAIAHLNQGLTWQYDRQDFAKAKLAYAAALALKPDLKAEVDGHLARMSATANP
ncbi:MAG: hypothetical protein WCJ14_00205 [Verrucomicrobiota bacterium]